MDPNEKQDNVLTEATDKKYLDIQEISTDNDPNLDDEAAAARLLWKLDLRVLPMLMVLWFLSFVDRINIANAKVQGMEKSLHMKGNDYNVALTVSVIVYLNKFVANVLGILSDFHSFGGTI
jgi:hypothetical protein